MPRKIAGAVITLQYSVSRAEIWRWYWRAWARPLGLWRYHLFLAANVFVLICIVGRPPGHSVLGAAAIGGLITLAVALVVFPLWPQLKFKPEARTLTVDHQGISTKVGTWNGFIPWRVIKRIAPGKDGIFIEGMKGNAFIVPDRAFIAPQQRSEFLERVAQWHSEGAA